MNRRAFLRGTAAAGAVGTVGLAGCLEQLGFEEESAFANPPLVENRPDAVYLPSSRDAMGMYGMATDGDYAAMLSYTFPHRFWTVEATDEEKELIEITADDSLHLMVTVWDRETHTVLPVDARIEIRQDGELVDIGSSSLWPMISQRMGFHYGDNIQLPGEGQYTARIQVGPVTLERTGTFAERLGSLGSLEIDFEYVRSDIHDLSFETIPESQRGNREALSLMKMEHGGGDGGHTPMGQATPLEELPGESLDAQRSGDATFAALVSDADRLADGGSYLAVSPRTPYNRIILPFTSLSATVERDGTPIYDEPLTLTEALDHEIGHHYGVTVDEIASGDRVTVTVGSSPQVSRHDGYETAFFDFDDVTYTV